MTPALQSFAYGVGSFAVCAPAALAALHLPGKVAPVTRLAALALLVHIAATAAAFFLFGAMPYWHGAALYWCCFVFALFAFSAVYKSVSLGILAELARAPDNKMAMNEIVETHIRPSFVGRTRILVAAGYVTELDGRFRLTDAGRRLARRVGAIQRFFGVTRSGLYGGAESGDQGRADAAA